MTSSSRFVLALVLSFSGLIGCGGGDRGIIAYGEVRVSRAAAPAVNAGLYLPGVRIDGAANVNGTCEIRQYSGDDYTFEVALYSEGEPAEVVFRTGGGTLIDPIHEMTVVIDDREYSGTCFLGRRVGQSGVSLEATDCVLFDESSSGALEPLEADVDLELSGCSVVND